MQFVRAIGILGLPLGGGVDSVHSIKNVCGGRLIVVVAPRCNCERINIG